MGPRGAAGIVDSQIHGALVADVDDSGARAMRAYQELRNFRMGFWVPERPMRRGLSWVRASRRSSERARWCARAVVGSAWIFVDYHGCDVAENGAAAVCG